MEIISFFCHAEPLRYVNFLLLSFYNNFFKFFFKFNLNFSINKYIYDIYFFHKISLTAKQTQVRLCNFDVTLSTLFQWYEILSS